MTRDEERKACEKSGITKEEYDMVEMHFEAFAGRLRMVRMSKHQIECARSMYHVAFSKGVQYGMDVCDRLSKEEKWKY